MSVCREPSDNIVLATILRAGLPFHHGFLNYFDRAENAFVSAYRKYKEKGDTFDVLIEYLASPILLLFFGSESEITGISETRHDI